MKCMLYLLQKQFQKIINIICWSCATLPFSVAAAVMNGIKWSHIYSQENPCNDKPESQFQKNKINTGQVYFFLVLFLLEFYPFFPGSKERDLLSNGIQNPKASL